MAVKTATIIAAKLTRGRVYFFNNVQYLRDVLVEVDEATALELEALYDEVLDTDGEKFEKYLFEVDWEAEPIVNPEDEKRRLALERRREGRRGSPPSEKKVKAGPRRRRRTRPAAAATA